MSLYSFEDVAGRILELKYLREGILYAGWAFLSSAQKSGFSTSERGFNVTIMAIFFNYNYNYNYEVFQYSITITITIM